MKTIGLAAALAFLTGCASLSEKLDPSYVEPITSSDAAILTWVITRDGSDYRFRPLSIRIDGRPAGRLIDHQEIRMEQGIRCIFIAWEYLEFPVVLFGVTRVFKWQFPLFAEAGQSYRIEATIIDRIDYASRVVVKIDRGAELVHAENRPRFLGKPDQDFEQYQTEIDTVTLKKCPITAY